MMGVRRAVLLMETELLGSVLAATVKVCISHLPCILAIGSGGHCSHSTTDELMVLDDDVENDEEEADDETHVAASDVLVKSISGGQVVGSAR